MGLPRNAEEAESSGEQFLERLGESLIIDEVQYAPKLFRILKHRIDRNRQKNGRYSLTGSQRFDLMQEASDSLAGRIGIIEIPTLSASEVESFQGRSIEGPALLDLIWRGGFPELHRDRRQPERFFASYIAS